MSTLKIAALFAILALTAPHSVRAACGAAWPNRSQVLDIRIDSCQKPEAFAAEAGKCVTAKWLLEMQEQAVKSARGSVLRGTVVAVRELTTYEDGTSLLGTTTRVEYSGVWFLSAGPDEAVSSSYPSGQVRQFVVSSPCCDFVPPSEFSCWFELDNLVHRSETTKGKDDSR